MNYKVLKNGELLRVYSCKVYPKPYNSTEHMEYVMFNVDDREEIVIESETEIKSGEVIGTSGKCTGENVTDPHIHFEMSKDGVLVNPTDYLPQQ